MRGEPYSLCKLFYDGFRTLHVGHFLKTPAGSAYRIERVHINRNRAYRQHCECLRWPVEAIPKRAVVHPLIWYPRRRKPGRSLQSLRQPWESKTT